MRKYDFLNIVTEFEFGDAHGENFMAIFTTLSVVIWFSTGTLGIFATLVYIFTMRVVIYNILSMAIMPHYRLPYCFVICVICYCEFHHAVSWKSPYGYSKFCNINTHKKKLIHCLAIFTILYGNYYPPHGEFKLICIGKFFRWTWVNFAQKYGKNRPRCQ